MNTLAFSRSSGDSTAREGIKSDGGQANPFIGRELAGKNRYRLKGLLGSGGTGEVYRAEDESGSHVAVKIARESFYRAVFEKEIFVLNLADSDSVVRMIDDGHTEEGMRFLVMELLEGRNLGEELQAVKELPWNRTKSIMLQLCEALEPLHSMGLVHRDLKPDNVMIQPGDIIKLMDFGFTVFAGRQEMNGDAPGTGVCGTPNYMAPEQMMEDILDQRTDIYAMGVMLYRMVTGVLPFIGNPLAVMTQHLAMMPTPPSGMVDTLIPEELDMLILRAMAKNPAHRFQSVDELGEALSRFEAGYAPTLLLPDAPSISGDAPTLVGKRMSAE
ncbi:MAG: serine/threonine-protein kinase [Candidatus Micrarchaeota archaeon]